MLVYLFLLMSAALAALLCFGFSLLSPWWLVPLFLGAFLLLNVLYLLYLLLTSYLFGFDHPYKKDNRYCRFMTHLTICRRRKEKAGHPGFFFLYTENHAIVAWLKRG